MDICHIYLMSMGIQNITYFVHVCQLLAVTRLVSSLLSPSFIQKRFLKTFLCEHFLIQLLVTGLLLYNPKDNNMFIQH